MTDAKKMALLACEALEDKKASDIKVIDIEQITTLIHLFDEENRLFYDLERIWRDGKVMDAKELKEEQ